MAIELYTTSTCPYCVLARQYLKRKGIMYKEFNVDEDTSALSRMKNLSGQVGVPVIVSGTHNEPKVVVGYDPDRISDIVE